MVEMLMTAPKATVELSMGRPRMNCAQHTAASALRIVRGQSIAQAVRGVRKCAHRKGDHQEHGVDGRPRERIDLGPDGGPRQGTITGKGPAHPAQGELPVQAPPGWVS